MSFQSISICLFIFTNKGHHPVLYESQQSYISYDTCLCVATLKERHVPGYTNNQTTFTVQVENFARKGIIHETRVGTQCNKLSTH